MSREMVSPSATENQTSADERQRQQAEIDALGPWFHNLHLPSSLQTAPNHELSDFPSFKWPPIAPHLPADLTGWEALDIGCNAGFYSFQLAQRGARVTAIDIDEHYLRQARWAAAKFGVAERITFQQRQVYDLASTPETYDLVWFMGVLYHFRYPLLALDIVARKTRRLMMFQTLTSPGQEVIDPPDDLPLSDRAAMRQPGWPTMAFIERRLANDPTNWWAANHACVEAMLRSSGLETIERPLHETYLCRPAKSSTQELAPLLEAEYQAATGLTRRT